MYGTPRVLQQLKITEVHQKIGITACTPIAHGEEQTTIQNKATNQRLLAKYSA